MFQLLFLSTPVENLPHQASMFFSAWRGLYFVVLSLFHIFLPNSNIKKGSEIEPSRTVRIMSVTLPYPLMLSKIMSKKNNATKIQVYAPKANAALRMGDM